MSMPKDDKALLKLSQLLATSDVQSIFSIKYAEHILHKNGNINCQISADTYLGFIQPELLGCTILHLAYKENKLELFNLLVNHGINLNAKNLRGSTVLHQIIEETYEKEAECSELKVISENLFVTSVLDKLVTSGNSCNPCNEKGITNFHIACMANHKMSVELFLNRKVFINEPVSKDSSIFSGYTALHFAARFSNLDIVTRLLAYGATTDIKDAKGITPLHLLIRQNIEIADMLNKNEVVNAEHLMSQRDVNENIICVLLNEYTGETDVIDDTDLTRLHIASLMESSVITKDLLGESEYLNQAVNSSSSLFAGNTALHFAALCNIDKVKFLSKKGANMHLKNAKGQTAFDLCLERYKVKDISVILASRLDWSQVEVSVAGGKLLDLTSCLQTCDSSSNKVGENLLWPSYDPLHLAVILSERGCKDDVMLVENVVRDSTAIDRIAKSGTSPLHLAFRLKKERVVHVFLKTCKSTVNHVDSGDLSHLHVACAAGATTAVEDLLLTGAKVNASVRTSFEWYRHPQSSSDAPREVFIPKGSTPLHIAVIVGHCEMMKLLLDHGADVYAKDEHGMTPIHWLIASDNPISPAANILLSKQTSRPISSTSSANDQKRLATTPVLKECITRTGLSHLHVACFANNLAAVEELLQDGSSVNATSLCTYSDDAKRFPGKRRYAGYAPLHFALESENDGMVRLLIQYGAHVLMSNPMKKSIPLYEAFEDELSSCAEVLRAFFKSNEALQRQIEEYTGLTMLHFYCCSLNVEAAEKLLKDGAADINRPMLATSPIWPGFTPLHILIKSYQASCHKADTLLLKLLLDYGADVTLANAKRNTPLHLAYNLDVETNPKKSLLETLLISQKNFDINPRNNGGLTHFHVACILGDVIAIEKFLKCNVDVNQPIDYFYADSESMGCAPLHLVLFHPLNQEVDVTVRLKAVTTLIMFGADVRTENVLGNTPLHLTARYRSKHVDFLNKIADAGSDIYAKNIFGQTPLELMLNSKDVTVAGIKVFLDRGYCANAFNPVTQKGFLAIIFSTCSYLRQQRPALELMLKACISVSDEMRRTVIHNVVSTSMPVIPNKCYTKIIESLVKIVDVDHQDNLGRTALHVATQFKNHQAVFALLQAGADINIIDANGKTAFVYAIESSSFFEGSQDNSEAIIVEIFSSYVQKLNICVLDVHEKNHSALVDAFKKYNVDAKVKEYFYDELEEMKQVKIDSSSITLLNVISGTSIKSVISCVSRLKSNAIDRFFETLNKTCFSESIGIIRLQFRKIFRKSVAH